MRYSPEQKEQTAANILKAAARGFRVNGYGGLGVDGLAQDAGVTSGAFYKHYQSKAAAFDAVVESGMAEYRAGVARFQAENGDQWLRALADYYFGDEHVSSLPDSCVVPGLSSDVARGSLSAKTAYQTGLQQVAKTLARGLKMPAGPARKDKALVLLALLSGGVTMVRSVEDPKLARSMAAAMHAAVLELGS